MFVANFKKFSDDRGREGHCLEFAVQNDDGSRYGVISMGPRKLCAVVSCIMPALQYLREHGGDQGRYAIDAFLQQFNPVEKHKLTVPTEIMGTKVQDGSKKKSGKVKKS